MHLEEKTVNSESIYKGRIFEVTKDTALLENGKEVLRDVVHHSGGVTVIPITDNNEILMVRQYRCIHNHDHLHLRQLRWHLSYVRRNVRLPHR